MGQKTRLRHLAEQIAEARSKLTLQASERAMHRDSPEAGDLFEDPCGSIGIIWAFLQRDCDSPEWAFVVPCDDHPLVGIFDVRVPPQATFGPLVLRCGCGMWLTIIQMARMSSAGRLDSSIVLAARKRLGSLIRGEFVTVSREREADADLEYETWMDHVATVCDLLAQWATDSTAVPSRPIVKLDGHASAGATVTCFSQNSDSTGRRAAESIGSSLESLPLAAASGGLMGKILQVLAGRANSPVADLPWDEPTLRTNPVWCLEVLARQAIPGRQISKIVQLLSHDGIPLPRAASDRFAEELAPTVAERPLKWRRKGVVALLSDASNDAALIAPLVAELSPRWHVVPNLPFTVNEVQGLLWQLLVHSNAELIECQRAVFGVRIEDRLGRRATGASVTVAGVLAVLDAASQHSHPLLECACALVQLGEDGRLRPVDQIELKLEAFDRELGQGSLLIHPGDCEQASRFESMFETVWEVNTLADLAKRLEAAGLLAPFHTHTPLDRHKAQIALARMRSLMDDQYRYRDALQLGESLIRHPMSPDVPLTLKQDIQHAVAAQYRHLGRFDNAVRLTRTLLKRSIHPARHVPYDIQARAAAEFAASLFDAHQFDEVVRVLQPWRARLLIDAPIASVDSHVAVFNTLARAQIVLGQPGWEENLAHSYKLQGQDNPLDQARTTNYRVFGLLRMDRLREAANWIRRLEASDMSSLSRWHLRFCQAELARRRGETWQDPWMDSTEPSEAQVGHLFAFYFQATARQPGRNADDAIARFGRATDCFLQDVRTDEAGNIQVFLAACARLAAAGWASDPVTWRDALVTIRGYLTNCGRRHLSHYYRSVLPKVSSRPSLTLVESLLSRIPFF